MPTFDDFVQDAPTAPVSDRFVSPELQARRDAEGLTIRQGELNDPNISDADKSAIRREITRMGGAAPAPKAKKAGISFDDFGPEVAAALPPPPASPSDVETGVRRTVSNFSPIPGISMGNAVSLGDLLLGIPGQLIGIGGDIGGRARAIGRGDTRTEQASTGAFVSSKANEVLGQPLAKLMNLAGLGEDKSDVDSAMHRVADWIAKGGEWVEKNTGGLLVKGDVESITNAAMGAAGGRGLAAGLREIAPDTVTGGTKLNAAALRRLGAERTEVSKAADVEARAAEAADAIPPMETKLAGGARTEATWKSADIDYPVEVVKGDTNTAPDGRIHQKVRYQGKETYVPADELTTTTVKGKTVEPVILEKDAAGNLSEAVPPMGEDLPKPGTIDTALAKVSEGRAFDMTAEERIAYKGWKDEPLDTAILDAEGAPLTEGKVVPRGQRGSVDTELLKPLGGAAIGAALGLYLDKEPGDTGLGGAVLGSLIGGFAGSRAGAKMGAGAVDLADKGLGLLSTRIGNISEPVLHRAREFERRVLGDTHARIGEADPLLVQLEKAKSPELDRAIKTNNPAETARLMSEAMKPAWERARAMLDEVGEKLREVGLVKDLRQDYFPRIVKDRAGLLKSLGAEERAGLQQALLDANTRAAKAGQGALDIAEESAVINKFLEGQARKAKPGFTKARVLEEVTEATDPFYATNAEALHTYLASATQAIERARFFGKDLITKTEDGRTTVDLNSSIGRVVQRELESGKIDPRQAEDLSEMLRARFESRPQAGVVQDVKNAANLGLLGNIISAGTQLGDLATAVYMEGLRPSLEALGRSLSRNNRITIKDFGLVDHISEEFSSTRGTAKVLNAAFRLSGFAAVDALGKNVLLNAALSKFQRLAKTAAGEREIVKRFSKSFGDDTPALVDELRSGKVGEQTRAMLFQELSKAQPISKLEVPQSYLEMPNGRLLYMLKTFMLKQADIVRRDAYNEIKAGHKAVGLANLTKYALALGISGMATDAVKNWLLGRPIDLSPTNLAVNMVKTFGFSQYVLDKVRQGKPMEAVGGVVAPPYKMMDDIIRDNSAASRYIPIVGPLLYSHVFGGADKEQARAGAVAKKAGQPRTSEQIAAAKRLKEKRRLERKARKANP